MKGAGMPNYDELAKAMRNREKAQAGLDRWKAKLDAAEAAIQGIITGTITTVAVDEDTDDEPEAAEPEAAPAPATNPFSPFAAQ